MIARKDDGGYRYLYGGMEREDQLTGQVGGHYNFDTRIYDPKTGRFLSLDPLLDKYPFQSPFAYALNSPIQCTDEHGEFANFIVKYGVEVGINIALQMVTAYMLNDEVQSWGDAWDEVSMWDAVTESALDMVGPGKLKMLGQAAINVFNYIDEVGIDNVTTMGLMEAGLTSVLENVMGDKAGKMGADAFAKGMKKLGVNVNDLGKMNADVGVVGGKKPSVQKYEVGDFDDLQKRSDVGDGLDLHHVPQKHPAGQVIEGYDPKNAPTIAVPSKQHKAIPTKKGEYSGTARDQLAKDSKDLRKVGVPNDKVKEVIDYNKSKYPDAYKKSDSHK